MTEAEWLECNDLWKMLGFRGVNDRKLQLFSAACCRCIWDQFTDQRSRDAVIAAERFADGLIESKHLRKARDRAQEVLQAVSRAHARAAAVTAASQESHNSVKPGTFFSNVNTVARAVIWSLVREQVADVSREIAKRTAVEELIKRKLVMILRDIVGNPFRPYPAPASWPTDVVHLADAMYAGQDCHHYALHDALLEAGHAEMAEHFREPGHPKGCWALDLILGKV